MKLVPPPHLVDRVFPLNSSSAEENERSFIESGERSVREIVAALRLCGVELSKQEVLDWGCGPGRVDLRLLEQFPHLRLTGVDVDPGCIDWLSAVCPGATFRTLPLLPPTDLPSDRYDICINHSVLTHLDRGPQVQWLAEIARALRVDGIFVTSVHGVEALVQNATYLPANSALRESWIQQWKRDKFVWVVEDSFTGSTHHAGYHTSFQDPSTVEVLSGYQFEPLLYAFHGDLGFQDLLVLRKRAPAQVALRSNFAERSSSEAQVEAATALPPTTDDMVRSWRMAAESMTRLGNQIARLEDELLRLKLQLARSEAAGR